jgi:uncharacterized protein (TIGR00369 family)
MEPQSLRTAGWKCLSGRGFNAEAGPYWVRGEAGSRELGLLVELRHGNEHMGTLHGGALMTFADICLGYAASDALNSRRCVTAQLQVHFVEPARAGEFICCKPEVVRSGKHLVFMRGLVKVGARTIASLDGIWKALEQK